MYDFSESRRGKPISRQSQLQEQTHLHGLIPFPLNHHEVEGVNLVIAFANQTQSTERDSYPTTEWLTHQHDPHPAVPVVESHQRVGDAVLRAAALLLCGVVGLISHAVVASHQTQLRLFALLQQMLMRQAEGRIG